MSKRSVGTSATSLVWGVCIGLAAGVVLSVCIVFPSLGHASYPRARFDRLSAFSEALVRISSSHVQPAPEAELVYGAIEGMLSALDPNSEFFPPSDYQRLQEDTKGRFSGVGVVLVEPDGNGLHPSIKEVVALSPADKAGVRVGEELVAIDDKAATIQDLRSLQEFQAALRGPEGSRVELSLSESGSTKAPREVTLLRRALTLPSVRASRLGSVLHVKIERFRAATAADIANTLQKELRKDDSLVLDLRGNPGGLLNQGTAVANLFLDKGDIVQIRSRKEGKRVIGVSAISKKYTKVPLVVLIDQNTASAAEVVAGALQDAKLAHLVGTPSYGKGSIQTFYGLRDGSGMKLTTARFFTPKGHAIDGEGLRPDHLVEAFEALEVRPQDDAQKGEVSSCIRPLSCEELATEEPKRQGRSKRDPQMRKAMQILGSK